MVWSNSSDWPPRNTKTANEILDDDDADAKATTDVTIAVNNDAATASVKEDEGNHLWWKLW